MSDVNYIEICTLNKIDLNTTLVGEPHEIAYERVPIRKDTVVDILQCGLFSLPVKLPSKIFIGPDELLELTGDYRWAKLDFKTSVLFDGIYRQYETLYGIELVIIPHMKGVLII